MSAATMHRLMSKGGVCRSTFTQKISDMNFNRLNIRETLLSMVQLSSLFIRITIPNVLFWIFLIQLDSFVLMPFLDYMKGPELEIAIQDGKLDSKRIIICNAIFTLFSIIMCIVLVYGIIGTSSPIESGLSELKDGPFDLYPLMQSYQGYANACMFKDGGLDKLACIFGKFVDKYPRPNTFLLLHEMCFIMFLLLLKMIVFPCIEVSFNFTESIQPTNLNFHTDNLKKKRIGVLLIVLIVLIIIIILLKNQLLKLFVDDQHIVEEVINGAGIAATTNIGKFHSMNGYYQVGKDWKFEGSALNTNIPYNQSLNNFKDRFSFIYAILGIFPVILPYTGIVIIILKLKFYKEINAADDREVFPGIGVKYKHIYYGLYVFFGVMFVFSSLRGILEKEDVLFGILTYSSVLLFLAVVIYTKINVCHYVFSITSVICLTLLYLKHGKMLNDFEVEIAEDLKNLELDIIQIHGIPQKELGKLKRIIYEPGNLAYGERILISNIAVEFYPENHVMLFRQNGKLVLPSNIVLDAFEATMFKLFQDEVVDCFTPFNKSVMSHFNGYNMEDVKEEYERIQSILQTKLLVIQGKSGSGKTSFVNMIALVDPMYKDKIFFEFDLKGEISKVPFAHVPYCYRGNIIQYSLQSPNKMTFMSSSIKDLSKSNGISLEQYVNMFNEFELNVDVDKPLCEALAGFSGGELARAALILNLIEGERKKMVFLDEPNAAIDRLNSEKVVKHIRKISGLTGIIAHHVDFIEDLTYITCDISDGKVKLFYHADGYYQDDYYDDYENDY